jgi:protein-tyrosine phosphatase
VLTVVFVCTGNICRSPMAALMFAERLRRAGLAEKVRVSSAGTGSWHAGGPADPRTVDVLERNGYPGDHTARELTDEDLSADLLVAMSLEHQALLRRLAGDPERVRLLRSFGPERHRTLGVPDPYYDDDRGFDRIFAMMDDAMPGLLDWVRERL